jgi:hypothetical protein
VSRVNLKSPNPSLQVRRLEITLCSAGGHMDADQRADAAGIDIVDVLQIQGNALNLAMESRSYFRPNLARYSLS